MEALAIDLFSQWEHLLRVLLAGACGGLIGLERSSRQKEAGIRTHVILALGAALIMVVSKYGFDDVIVLADVALDPSRLASNVITGVSFLGAGVIFVRGGSIKGLTTAAGIWATAGIGLALGAGMYALGLFSTLLIILIQVALHRFVPPSELLFAAEVSVTLTDEADSLACLRDELLREGFTIQGMNVHTQGHVTAEFALRFSRQSDLEKLLPLLEGRPEVKNYSIQS